jgi:glutathione S-transferase
MKLYFAPGACSLSPHVREAGMNFDLEQVNNHQKKTKSGVDYWTINGKGQVSVLEFDNGERLTEGPAIVQWIADQNPASGLVPPAGKPERYRVQEWLNFITSELHKTFGPIFRPTTPDAYKTISKENLGKRFDWLDKQLVGKQYLMGDKFTVADAYLLTATMDQPHRHGPRQVADPQGLCGPRRRPPQGAGGAESGGSDQITDASMTSFRRAAF